MTRYVAIVHDAQRGAEKRLESESYRMLGVLIADQLRSLRAGGSMDVTITAQQQVMEPHMRAVWEEADGWHWGAAGPRGERHGTAVTYRDAWDTADTALLLVCRQTPDEPDELPAPSWLARQMDAVGSWARDTERKP